MIESLQLDDYYAASSSSSSNSEELLSDSDDKSIEGPSKKKRRFNEPQWQQASFESENFSYLHFFLIHPLLARRERALFALSSKKWLSLCSSLEADILDCECKGVRMTANRIVSALEQLQIHVSLPQIRDFCTKPETSSTQPPTRSFGDGERVYIHFIETVKKCLGDVIAQYATQQPFQGKIITLLRLISRSHSREPFTPPTYISKKMLEREFQQMAIPLIAEEQYELAFFSSEIFENLFYLPYKNNIYCHQLTLQESAITSFTDSLRDDDKDPKKAYTLSWSHHQLISLLVEKRGWDGAFTIILNLTRPKSFNLALRAYFKVAVQTLLHKYKETSYDSIYFIFETLNKAMMRMQRCGQLSPNRVKLFLQYAFPAFIQGAVVQISSAPLSDHNTLPPLDRNLKNIFLLLTSLMCKDCEGKYSSTIIDKCSATLYRTIECSGQYRNVIVALLTSLDDVTLSTQISQSLCRRFYPKLFNRHCLPGAWQLVIDLTFHFDIGYSRMRLTRDLAESWIHNDRAFFCQQLATPSDQFISFPDLLLELIETHHSWLPRCTSLSADGCVDLLDAVHTLWERKKGKCPLPTMEMSCSSSHSEETIPYLSDSSEDLF